jgi:Ca2+-binding EF-hand superfamily protein
MRPPLALAGLVFAAVAGSASAQPRPDAAQMFALADANHDGVVSPAEFRASREARFKVLDRNHDGVLTAADFPAGGRLTARWGEGPQALLKMLDADGDGRVSLDEFVQGSMRLFDRADANHDGVVSQAEAQAARASIRDALMARR